MVFYKRFLLSLANPFALFVLGIITFTDPVTGTVVYTTDGIQNIALPDNQYYPLLITLSLILAFNISFFFLRFTSSFFNQKRSNNR